MTRWRSAIWLLCTDAPPPPPPSGEEFQRQTEHWRLYALVVISTLLTNICRASPQRQKSNIYAPPTPSPIQLCWEWIAVQLFSALAWNHSFFPPSLQTVLWFITHVFLPPPFAEEGEHQLSPSHWKVIQLASLRTQTHFWALAWTKGSTIPLII